MLIPGLDLIRLFILRISKGRNPLTPDRLHLHHLLLLKFSYTHTLTIIMLLISMPIFLNYFVIDGRIIIGFTLAIYFLLIIILKKIKAIKNL